MLAANMSTWRPSGKRPIIIPNPHKGDIDPSLLSKILRDAGIDRDKWVNA